MKRISREQAFKWIREVAPSSEAYLPHVFREDGSFDEHFAWCVSNSITVSHDLGITAVNVLSCHNDLDTVWSHLCDNYSGDDKWGFIYLVNYCSEWPRVIDRKVTDPMFEKQHTVTPKFALALARVCAGFIQSGDIFLNPNDSPNVRRSSLTFRSYGDDEDAPVETLPPVDVSGSSVHFHFVDTEKNTEMTLSVISGIELPAEAAYEADVVSYLGHGGGASVTPGKVIIPEKVPRLARELSPDGTHQVVYNLATRTVFISWDAPGAREHCVAVFILPGSLIEKLSA